MALLSAGGQQGLALELSGAHGTSRRSHLALPGIHPALKLLLYPNQQAGSHSFPRARALMNLVHLFVCSVESFTAFPSQGTPGVVES